MKCTICQNEIPAIGNWTQGNNAEPVVRNGRCCTECDTFIVIPMRLAPRMGARAAVGLAFAMEEATKKMKEQNERKRPAAS